MIKGEGSTNWLLSFSFWLLTAWLRTVAKRLNHSVIWFSHLQNGDVSHAISMLFSGLTDTIHGQHKKAFQRRVECQWTLASTIILGHHSKSRTKFPSFERPSLTIIAQWITSILMSSNFHKSYLTLACLILLSGECTLCVCVCSYACMWVFLIRLKHLVDEMLSTYFL